MELPQPKSPKRADTCSNGICRVVDGFARRRLMRSVAQESMRSAITRFLALLTGIACAGQPANDNSPLLRVPDLAPQLTKEEVSMEFNHWIEKVNKAAIGWKPESSAKFLEARNALGPKLPRVTRITLYSLFPHDGPNIRSTSPKRADELEQLPRFHDFPILGQLSIDDALQANRWVDFLRDQILPGGFFACDFMPRHGFRLSTVDGNIDILMCYSCDQLSYFGTTKLDNKHNPVFSSATKAQLNQLFDKLKIKRDEPSKNKG